MTPQDELRCLIKKAQIDIGKHHYTDRLRKEIRESCNVDIEDLINPILAWHKKELERGVPSVEEINKAIRKECNSDYTDDDYLSNAIATKVLSIALHRMMKERIV